ncbi:hypothetical protein PV328_004113 [Microctonus aethiopoides]|uniref:Uncharacterized protein n=1 Tax=Microctonus aethiopoides TaxID=144406 RepID=A0AA39KLD3_9HYME|nr:hypothetical protein PV328_004113 [Microctonus aethiopoides]
MLNLNTQRSNSPMIKEFHLFHTTSTVAINSSALSLQPVAVIRPSQEPHTIIKPPGSRKPNNPKRGTSPALQGFAITNFRSFIITLLSSPYSITEIKKNK